MDKLKRYIAQGKIMAQEIWQKQRLVLQKSGFLNKIIGITALFVATLFLLVFGVLSLLILGFLFFIATLQLIFFGKRPYFRPTTQNDKIIIETTAVRKPTD